MGWLYELLLLGSTSSGQNSCYRGDIIAEGEIEKVAAIKGPKIVSQGADSNVQV